MRLGEWRGLKATYFAEEIIQATLLSVEGDEKRNAKEAKRNALIEKAMESRNRACSFGLRVIDKWVAVDQS